MIACDWSTSCSFQSTFVDPMSHTILYALLRAFMELICYSGNGLKVDGKPFHLDSMLLKRMNSFMATIQYPSAYNRWPPSFDRCCITLSTVLLIVDLSRQYMKILQSARGSAVRYTVLDIVGTKFCD